MLFFPNNLVIIVCLLLMKFKKYIFSSLMVPEF